MLLLYFVMMLVATPLTMGFSLGQIRFCYMCGGARGARGLVFTRVIACSSDSWNLRPEG